MEAVVGAVVEDEVDAEVGVDAEAEAEVEVKVEVGVDAEVEVEVEVKVEIGNKDIHMPQPEWLSTKRIEWQTSFWFWVWWAVQHTVLQLMVF